MPSIPYLVPVLGVLGYRLVITTEADA
jgi:hypothetical protein